MQVSLAPPRGGGGGGGGGGGRVYGDTDTGDGDTGDSHANLLSHGPFNRLLGLISDMCQWHECNKGPLSTCAGCKEGGQGRQQTLYGHVENTGTGN